ncbi:MAG: hypothetical protein PHG51_06355 [Candidatus Omnitrophica bacterium]|nr:hypothetical protein [Candidatus Omnitrophota bacterium]
MVTKVSKLRISGELGEEKMCIDCGEWWPNDKEFFPSYGPEKHQLLSRCKDCYKIYRKKKKLL